MTASLDTIAARVRVCTQCELHRMRTNAVPGHGNPDAEVMFIGEGPGWHEDRQGLPFVGAAGQFLNEMLQSIGLSRDEVFITNIVKCRPPGNRDPDPAEIEACAPYLDRQLELVDPLVVVSLGAFATRYLLGRPVGVTRVRGRRFRWRNDATLVPTLHPAAVLRGGASKMKDARDDFAVIRSTIDKARTYRVKRRAAEGTARPDAVATGDATEDPAVQATPMDADDAGQLGLF